MMFYWWSFPRMLKPHIAIHYILYIVITVMCSKFQCFDICVIINFPRRVWMLSSSRCWVRFYIVIRALLLLAIGLNKDAMFSGLGTLKKSRYLKVSAQYMWILADNESELFLQMPFLKFLCKISIQRKNSKTIYLL